MIGIRSIAVGVIILALSGAANAVEPTRIDASTDASTQASWDRMLGESSDHTKCELRAALVKLNSVAATEQGFRGIAFHAALQDPSVIRIRDKIAGFSAQQIVEFASQASPGPVVCER